MSALVPSTDPMSSFRSSQSPIDSPDDELRRKGSRGGKRSVTHLSKAQLARKRANDREAQRNIRQRTKEHIESLERKVRELEGSRSNSISNNNNNNNHRSSSIERILKRNQELESEIARLRAQLHSQQVSSSSSTSSPTPNELLPEDLLVSHRGRLTTTTAPSSSSSWIPELSKSWPGAVPSHLQALESHADMAVSSPYAHSEAPTYASDESHHIYAGRHHHHHHDAAALALPYDPEETEASQTHYTAMTNHVWEDHPVVFRAATTTQSLSRPIPAWTTTPPPPTSYHTTTTPEPPSFPVLPQTSFPLDHGHSHAHSHVHHHNHNTYPQTSAWQTPPPPTTTTTTTSSSSSYAWQLSTKLKAPITHVDQLMFAAINCQRHLQISADLTGEDLLGPGLPSVHLLFDQPGPPTPVPSSLSEVMERYAAVQTARGFIGIPEKVASFMCMYRFVQWQISPAYETFQALHAWQAPHPAQLVVPHPAWMDLPPWAAFREKIIQCQERYGTPEFQHDYAANVSVNFPHDPMKAVVFVDGQIVVSELLERHVSEVQNFSMKRPFAEKYPEFADVCRFDEI